MAETIKFLLNHRVEIMMDDTTYLSNIQDVEEEYAGISIPVMKEAHYD